MNSRFSPADATAAVLLEHRDEGIAVMIPGAFERRARLPAVPPTPETAVHVTPHCRNVSNRGRLEREREGGGAPSQRAGRRRGTLMSRLWQSALHPTQLSDIWRRLQAV
jgi:hypothetical protein